MPFFFPFILQKPTYQTENSVKYIVNPTGTIYAMHGASGNQNRSPYAVDEKLFELGTSSVVCSYAEIKVDPDRITIYIKYSDKGRSKTLQSYGIIKNQ